ncbi:phage major capsid protein [Cutibacterium sp. WCA-380-WT-3A]|uniref:Phage major capsid protein n=1 Tax=Cutibacterium porci TaxID=2605781 RepID=A0A7K0J5W9_9ACTN|nr:phage major capsid protein [Cutibacterium porci]MSS45334.1 phage major capsid protein [Cutibacterium porci]
MTISDLRTKRAETWEKAKAFLDDHRNTDGILSAEDDATYAHMEADIDALANEIPHSERAQRRDADMARATAAPLVSMPEGSNIDPETAPSSRRATNTYKQAFWNAVRLNASPLEVRNALSEGVDTEGGYLVPDEFEHTLVQSLADQNIVRPLARVIQTTSGDRKIPVVATPGTASWLDEGSAYTESDEKFTQLSLSAHKLGTFLKISEKLLNDAAFDIEAYLTAEFARRIGTAEEEAFIAEDGKGKPTGIFDATAGAQDGVTAAKATDITAGSPDLIFGKPVHSSAFVPEVKAGARSVAFGDLGYYWITDRQGRSFKRLNELFATTKQAVIMLATHFYESRDGATAGYWVDKSGTTDAVWNAVNTLLRFDRDWKI